MLTLGVGRRFDARRTSGLRLWLHAARVPGLANTDPISTWPDLSGNGNDLTGSGTARYTWQATGLNDRPAARADGSNDLMARANLSLTTFTVIVAIGNPTAIAGNGHVVGEYRTTDNNRKWRILRDNTPTNFSLNISSDGTGATVTQAAALLPGGGGPYVVTATYNGTTGRIRINAGAWSTLTSAMYATTAPQLTIGSRDGTGDPLGMDEGMITVWDRVLTDTELQRNERDMGRAFGRAVA